MSEDLARDVDCWPSDDETEDDIRLAAPNERSNTEQVDKTRAISALSIRSKQTLAKSRKSTKSNLTSYKAR